MVLVLVLAPEQGAFSRFPIVGLAVSLLSDTLTGDLHFSWVSSSWARGVAPAGQVGGESLIWGTLVSAWGWGGWTLQ